MVSRSSSIHFMESSTLKVGPCETLNNLADFFSRVIDKIDLEDALLNAGLDATYIIQEAEKIVKKMEDTGVLAKYEMERAEAQCIAMYTLELPSGKGKSPNCVINEALCGKREKKDLIHVRDLIVLLLRSLRKLPRVEKDVVYRGVKKDAAEWQKIDAEIMLRGFTATSTKMQLVNAYSRKDRGRLLVIEGPVYGYDIKEFSQFPDECEFLVEPDTLVHVFGTGKGQEVIQCKTKRVAPALLGVAPLKSLSTAASHLDKTVDGVFTLAKMRWSRTRYSSDDLSAFCELLGMNLTPTEDILFRENPIEPNGATMMSEALKENTTLKVLTMSNNRLGDEGTRILCDGLKKNKALKVLMLLDNNIGEEGARELSDMLFENKTLTQLHLKYNKIGAEGMEQLSDALKNNATLKELYLNGCEIGNEGATMVREALECNASLVTLNLYGNKITDEGAKEIAEGLKKNKTLTLLDLGSNDIGTEAKAELQRAWGGNRDPSNLVFY